MKNSLVIGGSGFLGSHLVDLLVQKGHKVTNFDKKKISSNSNKIRFVKGDMLNEKLEN